MQETFLRPIWERDRVVNNVCLLIRTARTMYVPVVPTVQYAERMGGIIPEVASILPEAQTTNKLCFSCAGSGEFLNQIETSVRNQILICGIETHICVCQTALDMVEGGFQVHVAADAVSSRSEQTWELGLRKMENSGIIIDSTEGAIYEMLRESGTPQFKEVLKLIKQR
jgi:nicotinamidase-related amidase